MTCPENALRGAMTDEQFWAHVYPDASSDDEELMQPEPALFSSDPCSECGANNACAYDAEGRPLIHAIGEKE